MGANVIIVIRPCSLEAACPTTAISMMGRLRRYTMQYMRCPHSIRMLLVACRLIRGWLDLIKHVLAHGDGCRLHGHLWRCHASGTKAGHGAVMYACI